VPAALRGGRGVVVKLGGDVLEGVALARVAEDIRGATARGFHVLVVHGGGAQVTALATELGRPPELVGGRRITDAATLDLLKMVVAGRLNVDLVAALRGAGAPAIGLCGASGIVRAHRRPPRAVAGSGGALVDFGLVGDIDGFDLPLLGALVERGLCPVIACLGADPRGGAVLNINADVVASQLAAAAGVAALVAVTAVGGVRRDRDDPATRIARLTVAEARRAIADGSVSGGMIPKLEEAFAPLAAGVGAVHIVAPGELERALTDPGAAGTWLLTA
jgi:acetylglutamate kinase